MTVAGEGSEERVERVDGLDACRKAVIPESREYLPQSWWAVTFPGVAILITVLGFNLFGDGLRDLVDPRLRRSR